MKTYISGRMSGIKGFNYNTFNRAAKILRASGCKHVLNPVENGVPITAQRKDHIRADIKMLLKADAIIMLPEWRKSKGAVLEREIAKQLELKVLYWKKNVKNHNSKRS